MIKHRRIAGLLTVLLAMGFVATVAHGKLGTSKPIEIGFAQRPSREIRLDEAYTLQVKWQNKDKRDAYEGSFAFIVKGRDFKVATSDMTFTSKGSVVSPQESGDSLVFRLPKQTFPAKQSGNITVEITYYALGRYSWEIGVTEPLQQSFHGS